MGARDRRPRRRRRSSAPRASSAGSPRSSRSPATSPTTGTAARSSTPPASRSTCSSTTPAMLGPSPQPRARRLPARRCSSASTASTCSRRSRSPSSSLPRMPDGGAIINVTSDAAVEPYAGWGGYGSSKAALDQLTAILAAEQPGAADLRGRPRRHAHPDAPGGVPRRGHLRPAAARGERARPARADRRRPRRAAATGRASCPRRRRRDERARVRAAGRARGARAARGARRRPRRGAAAGRRSRRPARSSTTRFAELPELLAAGRRGRGQRLGDAPGGGAGAAHRDGGRGAGPLRHPRPATRRRAGAWSRSAAPTAARPRAAAQPASGSSSAAARRSSWSRRTRPGSG